MVLKLVIVAAIAALFAELGCRLVFRQGLMATLLDILDVLDPRAAEARRLRKDRDGAGAIRQLIDKRRSTTAEVLRRTELVKTAAEVTEEVAVAEEKLAQARARLRAVDDKKGQQFLDRHGLGDLDKAYREAGNVPTANRNNKSQEHKTVEEE